MNPFELLQIPLDADDRTIRNAYFALLTKYPPDRDPEGFRRLRQAYEAIRHADARLGWKYGWRTEPRDKEALLAAVRHTPDRPRPAGPKLWLDLIAEKEDR